MLVCTSIIESGIDIPQANTLIVEHADPAAMAAAATSAGVSGFPGLNIEKPEVRRGEPLRLEIESFLDCVRTRSTPSVSGEDGRAALALALDITAAIAAHAERAGLERYMRAPQPLSY